MNNQKSKDKIKDIAATVDSSWRGDCPFCGGRNSMGMTKKDGAILYNCYKISCKEKGYIPYNRDMSTFQSMFKAPCEARTATKQVFKLPSYLVPGLTTPTVLKWASANGVTDAWKKGYCEVFTDVREERVCIPLYDADSRLVNIGGRATLPMTSTGFRTPRYQKFKLYSGNIVPPFRVGTGKTVVIVEDFASACRVSVAGYMGYALLGTHFNPYSQMPYLKALNPDRVVIALDKDALHVSMKIRNLLQFMYDRVIILPLEVDLKHMTNWEVSELLTNIR